MTNFNFWGDERIEAIAELQMINGQAALEAEYELGEQMNAWNQQY